MTLVEYFQKGSVEVGVGYVLNLDGNTPWPKSLNGVKGESQQSADFPFLCSLTSHDVNLSTTSPCCDGQPEKLSKITLVSYSSSFCWVLCYSNMKVKKHSHNNEHTLYFLVSVIS